MSESIAGMSFGRLIAIEIVGKTSDNRPAWMCICNCGNKVTVSEHNLKRGNTKSCGCLKRDKQLETHFSHGLCKSRLYRIWNNMRSRCDRTQNDNYKWYGGRGIKYTPEWKSFSCFSTWALANGYQENLELDRIDSNGNYSPDNCRFVTHQKNCRNRRKNNE